MEFSNIRIIRLFKSNVFFNIRQAPSRHIWDNERVNAGILRYCILLLNYCTKFAMLFNQVRLKMHAFAKITCSTSCRNCLRCVSISELRFVLR